MTVATICTIGYEGASVEELVAALKAARVTRIVDIRESPYSRRREFCREALAAALADYGIGYTHIRELGNPPAGREAAHAGHMAAYREIFTAHLKSVDGERGSRQALSLAAAETVCLLCLENRPAIAIAPWWRLIFARCPASKQSICASNRAVRIPIRPLSNFNGSRTYSGLPGSATSRQRRLAEPASR
ncbi:MAG: DUF488 domain-containing protein [Rhodomicrobium sp.]|nr:DUF488 domain-containing protein [Rhodomicrobium sp.]